VDHLAVIGGGIPFLVGIVCHLVPVDLQIEDTDNVQESVLQLLPRGSLLDPQHLFLLYCPGTIIRECFVSLGDSQFLGILHIDVAGRANGATAVGKIRVCPIDFLFAIRADPNPVHIEQLDACAAFVFVLLYLHGFLLFVPGLLYQSSPKSLGIVWKDCKRLQ